MNFTKLREGLSTVLGLVTLGITGIGPFFITIFLIMNRNNLSKPEFADKYGSMYEGLRTDSLFAYLYFTIFCFRRYIFCALAVYFMEYPFAQIMLYIIMSLGHLIYLILI